MTKFIKYRKSDGEIVGWGACPNNSFGQQPKQDGIELLSVTEIMPCLESKYKVINGKLIEKIQ
jgi:hypothetical protein